MINIKSKYKIYRNLNTHCLFKSQMLLDCNEPNTFPMLEVFISVSLSGLLISNMHSLVTCRSFLHPISGTGSEISVIPPAMHKKSWNTPKSLTASNLLFRHSTGCFWYSCGNLHAIKKKKKQYLNFWISVIATHV